MGWTYIEKPRWVKGYFWREWTTDKVEPVDIAIVNMREVYAAIRIKETGEVFAVVTLLHYVKNPSDRYDFGFKEMDETMGPYFYNCPERILKLLTPTDHENAKAWRERCWETVRKKKLLKKGKTIRFKEPIRFQDGARLSKFLVMGRSVFQSLENGRMYRISNVGQRDFEPCDTAA